MNNTLKIIALLLMTVFISIDKESSAQKNSKFVAIRIKTSAQCEMCKARIEKALAFEKGVKKASLDLETKEITVLYNPKKTDPQKIREAISNIGYDADDIKAQDKAYRQLPECCQKGGHAK